MPTISEPHDEEMRLGKTRSLLDYYARGMLGEATLRASLRILRHEPEDIRLMIQQANRSMGRKGAQT